MSPKGERDASGIPKALDRLAKALDRLCDCTGDAKRKAAAQALSKRLANLMAHPAMKLPLKDGYG